MFTLWCKKQLPLVFSLDREHNCRTIISSDDLTPHLATRPMYMYEKNSGPIYSFILYIITLWRNDFLIGLEARSFKPKHTHVNFNAHYNKWIIK